MFFFFSFSISRIIPLKIFKNKLLQFRKNNKTFKSLSFPTISGSGPNGAIIHYRVSKKTNKTLNKNNLYLFDSGAQYLDGTTDVTRTISIGDNPIHDLLLFFC